MVKIIAGSFANEIYTLEFDPSSGSLSLLSSITVGSNPTWITSHPAQPSSGTVIFAVLEKVDGEVVVVSFDKDGNGKIETRGISSQGDGPCSVIAMKDEIIVGNYTSGSVTFIPLVPDAPFLKSDSSTTNIQLSGSGPNERQLGSHAHQVILHPERQELLVPDLGADKVWRLLKGDDGKWVIRGHVAYTPGSAPRHVAFYEGMMYTIIELTSGLTAHRLPALPAAPTLTHTTPTLSNQPPLPNDMLAAEILIPTPNAAFPSPYLYISNRNDPSPEGDTIAIFTLADKEKPVLVREVRTGLKHVRGIEFGGPDNKWLVAGGVFGGGVKVFERTEGGKNLKLVAELNDVDAPTAFLWV
ncbi:3-carboxy-cis,cis-mucoante lactonizing enzyme [Athelia psychrophila]|uniref:3-carboxy-cis,cis-mucoante lactonizing enzyme n=1 Tax=Athelia psychrophila TaxID=1759441 RepID=A0A166RMF4_9AGAM|nr:3-carboxy-cis,cis-mucoante lactonizing enzyme [Fibularhizoctonia sp. CBS 109695]